VYSELTPDDGQRHCPKHVEFDAKNKFAKLVHLVGLIIKKSLNTYLIFLIFSVTLVSTN